MHPRQVLIPLSPTSQCILSWSHRRSQTPGPLKNGGRSCPWPSQKVFAVFSSTSPSPQQAPDVATPQPPATGTSGTPPLLQAPEPTRFPRPHPKRCTKQGGKALSERPTTPRARPTPPQPRPSSIPEKRVPSGGFLKISGLTAMAGKC